VGYIRAHVTIAAGGYNNPNGELQPQMNANDANPPWREERSSRPTTTKSSGDFAAPGSLLPRMNDLRHL
jgi:hypothetical protein